MEHARGRFRFIWIPRALMILFILFLTMFSFDVFEMEGTLLAKLGGFFIHSIPSLVLVAVLLVAWKNPLLGGILILGSAAALMLRWHLWRGMTFVTIILPIVFVGVLFIVSHFLNRKPTRSDGEQA
jgi:hypothetical protein